jgi:hypothetical protein
MVRKLIAFLGFLIVVLAAMTFETVKGSIYDSFKWNEFVYRPHFVDWSAPYSIVEFVVTLATLVLLAQCVVGLVFYTNQKAGVKSMYKVNMVLYCAIFFALLQMIAIPITTWVAMGSERAFEISNGLVWRNHISDFFVRENLYAIVPASLMMILAEMLRRRVTGEERKAMTNGWINRNLIADQPKLDLDTIRVDS